MNLQSLGWALNAGRQMCTDPEQMVLLLVIAGAVDRQHRGCVLSVDQLASASLIPADRVPARLQELAGARLIKPGDQALVSNYPPDSQPAVWDLNLARDLGIQGRTGGRMDNPAALYRLFGYDGELLYIGCTVEHDQRWARHAHQKPWWPEVARHTLDWYPTHASAMIAERQAIAAENPRYNIVKLKPSG